MKIKTYWEWKQLNDNNHSKINKKSRYIGLNLTKKVKLLYNENFKTL